MAAMDPNHQLAAMNEMMPPGFPGMPGRDMFNKGGKASATAKDTKSPHHAPSPRGSSQQDNPSPHPPSKQALLQEMEEITKTEDPHQTDLLLHQCHKPLKGHLLHLLLLQWLECLEE